MKTADLTAGKEGWDANGLSKCFYSAGEMWNCKIHNFWEKDNL